jgi:hypothetical protein
MKPYIIDMVHHNPGEAPFRSRFLDAGHLLDYGFNGQVFKHLNCIVTFEKLGVDVFPAGTPERAWLDEVTARIVAEIAAAKAAGLKVFHHIDLFVLPKRLVAHYQADLCDPISGKIQLDRPLTLAVHRAMFEELSARFPEVDGYIIRVGETYLYDAPHHVGNGPIPKVEAAWSPTYFYEETLGQDDPKAAWLPAQAEAYIELVNFLRDEICVKHERLLLFRTWDIFPDKLHARPDHYLEVTDRIEPHPKLVFSIKHTALDFWRHVKVNECLAKGRHPQIIEVQCQREYEGKAAFPNYVMHGVIDGFEENRVRTGLRDLVDDPRIVGVYSWSRGGGWYGPYIENELWADLNAYVLAGFFKDPTRPEQELFHDYATRILQLREGDAGKFRRLCLLSARAVLKGRHCAAFDRQLGEAVLPTACWMRDDRLGGSDQLRPVLDWLAAHGRLDEALAEKREAVELWNQICAIAGEIEWPAGADGDFAKVSAEYGRLLFEIVLHGWRVLVGERRGDDRAELADAVAGYEAAWIKFAALRENRGCPSLYHGRYFSLPGAPDAPGMDASVARCKERIASACESKGD